MSETKDIKYYMSLEYTIVFNKVNDEGKAYYYGKIAELDGCHTTADTIEQLLEELEEVKRDHIELKLAFGDPIPEPARMNEKFLEMENLKEVLRTLVIENVEPFEIQDRLIKGLNKIIDKELYG